jgi:hypothetical protein
MWEPLSHVLISHIPFSSYKTPKKRGGGVEEITDDIQLNQDGRLTWRNMTQMPRSFETPVVLRGNSIKM